MEADVYGIVPHMAAGIEVNDETLALDVIKKDYRLVLSLS